MSTSFLAHITSLSQCERLLCSSGDVACDLVEVSCASSGGGCEISMVVPDADAPALGALVRVTVEVVA